MTNKNTYAFEMQLYRDNLRDLWLKTIPVIFGLFLVLSMAVFYTMFGNLPPEQSSVLQQLGIPVAYNWLVVSVIFATALTIFPVFVIWPASPRRSIFQDE